MNNMAKRWLRGAAALALALQLGGCVEVVVGSAVVGGMAATDRRTLGAQTEDNSLTLRGEALAAKAGEGNHINVSSYNRRILLSGEVKDAQTKSKIEEQMRKLEGALDVLNHLEVSGASSLASRSSDALITGKIKTGLLANKQLQANSVKVVTERGTVYLLGRVTEAEGAQIADIARSASGVQKVLKLFEYISEEERKRLTPQNTSGTAQ
ncbi:BON domain-containing protein [Massilia sp. W12]|uniref:BON domain-containing protein n=1 Tax=Massilia sp. W12 TaxID=3126507 RepID=UPI0030D08476